jgi:hypothetical protein
VEIEQYDAMVGKIIDSLMLIKEPISHLPIIKSAYKRTDIYHGDAVSMAPDIIVTGYRDSQNCQSNVIFSGHNDRNPYQLFSDSSPYTGDHSDKAICISNHKIPSSVNSLADVTKLIMQIALDTPHNHEPASEYEMPPVSNPSFEKDEEFLLRQRLKDLGYLD